MAVALAQRKSVSESRFDSKASKHSCHGHERTARRLERKIAGLVLRERTKSQKQVAMETTNVKERKVKKQ